MSEKETITYRGEEWEVVPKGERLFYPDVEYICLRRKSEPLREVWRVEDRRDKSGWGHYENYKDAWTACRDYNRDCAATTGEYAPFIIVHMREVRDE